jgi:site-specific recombinase XerD
MEVFSMTRPHVELYVRWMEEEHGYAPATTARRLSTVVGFYRFAAIDGYLLCLGRLVTAGVVS